MREFFFGIANLAAIILELATRVVPLLRIFPLRVLLDEPLLALLNNLPELRLFFLLPDVAETFLFGSRRSKALLIVAPLISYQRVVQRVFTMQLLPIWLLWKQLFKLLAQGRDQCFVLLPLN